jgi:hypothetical protein
VEFDDRIRAALDRALADVRATVHDEVTEAHRSAELASTALRESVTGLSECIKAIDAASSLGAVLTMVSTYARGQAGAAGLLIVRDGNLVAYPSRTVVPPETATVVWKAAEARTPVIAGDAAAFPIALGGQVAAVLSTAAPLPPQTLATLDVLARHAGRVLEAMTFSRITGLAPVSARSHDTSAGNTP